MTRALVLVALAVTTAHADRGDEVARGEELGRSGSWTEAIAHFKAADRLEPRAQHACLIGLAYARREVWAEAELYFALCRRRATPADPIPDWLPDAEAQLAQKLATATAASITLAIDPPTAHAVITVSSFAPGEAFEARTFHLAPGVHTITITADGYEATKRTVVVTDAKPQTIGVTLYEWREKSPVPWALIGAGLAIGAGAVAYDELVLQPTRRDYAKTQYVYDRAKADFPTQQKIAIGLYATAAVVTAIGVALKYTVYGRHEHPPVQVGAVLAPGGGLVTLEWVP